MRRNGKFKLLLLDIDGTLLGEEGTISAEDKETLTRVRDAGIQVSLSTGRVILACRKIIHDLSLDGYHIFCDGALVSNPAKGDEIYAKPVRPELVKQAVAFAHAQGINLDLYSTSGYFVEKETWSSDLRRKFFDMECTVADFDRVWQKERIIKGTLVISSAEERAKAASFCLQFQNDFDFTATKTPAYPEIDFINVLAKGVGKGEALQTLAPYLGVTLTEIVAIGDGSNDISLLSRVGLAVAMNNAPDELKAVADYVTGDVGHSGVSQAIKKLLL